MWSRFISLLTLLIAVPADAFLASSVGASRHSTHTSVRRASTTTSTEDLLKPSYEIEPIPIRIGHGFDIHRMAPLQDAGQPIVIGGVEITHKDQKVSNGETLHVYKIRIRKSNEQVT